jgi:hypothetical protein
VLDQEIVDGMIKERWTEEIWGTKARRTPSGNRLDDGLGFFETLPAEVEFPLRQAVKVLVAPAMHSDFMPLARDLVDEVWALKCDRSDGKERGMGTVTVKAFKNPVCARREIVSGGEWHSPLALVVEADQELSTCAVLYALPV